MRIPRRFRITQTSDQPGPTRAGTHVHRLEVFMSRRRLPLLVVLLAAAAVACSNPVSPAPVAETCGTYSGSSTC